MLNDFVLHWYLKEQTQMKGFKNVPAFLNAYQKVDLWNELNNYATAPQKNTLKSLDKHKLLIQNQLLAILARMHWYKQGYFEVQNATNPNAIKMMP